MDFLALIVVALLGISAAATIGSRVGIAAPLLLMMAGIVVSLLPFVPVVEVEPEWILAGVIPPLLYSAAVSMPTMEFRRDFTTISGLSVLLVVISALLLGLLFNWLIPNLGFAGGVALGAVLSPTDAVAISIVKKLSVSPRAIVVLEGESLLNDATALVVLRSAIAGMAAAVSMGGVLGNFIYSVVVAVVIGAVVGVITLRVRARIEDSTVNTVISFTIPFIAAIPADRVGASGLVAAVVAGLVTGRGASRYLSPRHRLSDSQNWSAIEMILEGAIFLSMGLELTAVIEAVQKEQVGLASAIGIAALALLATVLIRAAYVAPLLLALKAGSRRGSSIKESFAAMQERISNVASGAPGTALPPDRRPPPGRGNIRKQTSPEFLERMRKRVQSKIADIDYMLAEPLGWREGVVVVWAGMRGAVTLAAAQTLPVNMPSRSLLIFIAFLVAVGSLLLQGGTLARLIKRLRPTRANPRAAEAEQEKLNEMLVKVAMVVLEQAGYSERLEAMKNFMANNEEDRSVRKADIRDLRLQMIAAQREALLDAQDNGEYSAAALSSALATLDADQISMELRVSPNEEAQPQPQLPEAPGA